MARFRKIDGLLLEDHYHLQAADECYFFGSALTEATIIVEAGETSGTLTQARAVLYQGRKLFILNSCFERDDITWPARFVEQGAIRVREPQDIWNNLG